ncbi:aminotransferase class I/II-fold pyridoxal phosphate-dependent enzyme [Exiguobacterium alkaliphilum]|uniref:Aminotransferase class I/II-fold pyridoxal phosphate-dependent enzyme n=1 Tax=Exiguobacterium alkaliphilum TaxID=1428684 RepID=A0ABT2L0P2_9BACL|nr:aminotransferase class I/II-fold pyridoxal phosphate-dependent enzyme [Exiguobacterium alkaliphilum]MCT4795849.1 aminotransferase class I/II-fold pyridoxal phosphate-dependent enzyme [Exiguobacterium alkaliphilum]
MTRRSKKNPFTFMEVLEQHVRESRVSFHVPGHHNGTVHDPSLPTAFHKIMPYDLTELEQLDDLHQAEGIIQQGEEALGTLYKSKSKWLVNGSTAGNWSMLAATVKRGERVYVQRNSHKSVWNAIEWLGLEPILLSPELERGSGIPTVVNLATVQEAVERYPGGKALLLTSPTYYGDMADIQAISTYLNQHMIPLLVDEAHGAHLIYDGLPRRSAIFEGASAVVQSAHKTLPAFTMGAWLHYKENVDENRLFHALSSFQTSSPSYLIMASLDHARTYLEHLTERDWSSIQTSHFAFVMELKRAGFAVKVGDDFTKVTILTYPKNGLIFSRHLASIGIDIELAAEDHVLLCLPLREIKMEEIHHWVKLIQNASKHVPLIEDDETIYPYPSTEQVSKLTMLHDVVKTVRLSFQDAVGQIAAETIIPYPPGIPWILKGEMVTEEKVRVLVEWISLGRKLQASRHVMMKQIDVIVEEF